MKLINLLIRELDNCSLGGEFRVSRHAEICQFNRFSLEINFKRAHSCNYEIPNNVFFSEGGHFVIEHNTIVGV